MPRPHPNTPVSNVLADTESATDPQESLDEDLPRRCRRCGNPITTAASAISIEGLHEHVQANPGGFVFLFGCFANAPGCDIIGEPTREHTWFAAYAWQIALCDQCQCHLGWYFRSGDDGFFGLLLDRLTRR